MVHKNNIIHALIQSEYKKLLKFTTLQFKALLLYCISIDTKYKISIKNS